MGAMTLVLAGMISLQLAVDAPAITPEAPTGEPPPGVPLTVNPHFMARLRVLEKEQPSSGPSYVAIGFGTYMVYLSVFGLGGGIAQATSGVTGAQQAGRTAYVIGAFAGTVGLALAIFGAVTLRDWVEAKTLRDFEIDVLRSTQPRPLQQLDTATLLERQRALSRDEVSYVAPVTTMSVAGLMFHVGAVLALYTAFSTTPRNEAFITSGVGLMGVGALLVGLGGLWLSQRIARKDAAASERLEYDREVLRRHLLQR